MAKVEFDISTLTLGELAMVEDASGLRATQLLSSFSSQVGLAVMVLASRSGEPVPSWQEIMNRKVADASSLILLSSADSPSETSSD